MEWLSQMVFWQDTVQQEALVARERAEAEARARKAKAEAEAKEREEWAKDAAFIRKFVSVYRFALNGRGSMSNAASLFTQSWGTGSLATGWRSSSPLYFT